MLYSLFIDGEKTTLTVKKASTFISRFKGLMFKKTLPKDEGLWITRCRQVHCFNMRFTIDVVFLDDDCRVLLIEEAMTPGKISRLVKEASSVLEINAFQAREYGIECGKRCELRVYK